ncbi:MAG: PA0069 family radical SAM protein [Isosphaeraceae bacterium]
MDQDETTVDPSDGQHAGRPRQIRGRGVAFNPPNRFESTWHELDPHADDPDLAEDPTRPRTQFLPDSSRSIVATNDSPDIDFDASLNPYRGCEHGCSYCYARPTHEYLGMSAGLDFETRIMVKHDAPDLLRKTLESPRWKPTVLALSGVTDAYQPAERRLRLTRACLEVLVEYRNPVIIVTKNALVVRDADLLNQLAEHRAVAVFVSITTLDAALARSLEPRTSPPGRRLDAVRALAEKGIPVGVMVAPLIPGLNDHEVLNILEAASQAGAKQATYVLLRLPGAVAPLFESWLETHRPGEKAKILNRLRTMRGGRLNDPRFGERMRGEGPIAAAIDAMFRQACRRNRLNESRFDVSTDAFSRPSERRQLRLFD